MAYLAQIKQIEGKIMHIKILTLLFLLGCKGEPIQEATQIKGAHPVESFDSSESFDSAHKVVRHLDLTKDVKPITYTVRGKKYRTYSSKELYVYQEHGLASWYGPGFHGHKTANGEIYNMHALTAAHKRLPLGTKVRVTNLDNGKSVVVRINDRGPFHGSRVIDLSRAAAKRIGALHKGVVPVNIVLY